MHQPLSECSDFDAVRAGVKLRTPEADESLETRRVTGETASPDDLGDQEQVPIVVLIVDGRQIATFPLSKRIISIGRSSQNDISLDDAGVSRRHAQIITVHGQSVIEDLGSRNGTFVNFKWVTSRELVPGDDIVISKYRLIFRQEEGPNQDEVAALLGRWRRADGGAADRCPMCGQSREGQDTDTGDTRPVPKIHPRHATERGGGESP